MDFQPTRNPGGSYVEILNYIYKDVFPNKLPFIGSTWTWLLGRPLRPLQATQEGSMEARYTCHPDVTVPVFLLGLLLSLGLWLQGSTGLERSLLLCDCRM